MDDRGELDVQRLDVPQGERDRLGHDAHDRSQDAHYRA
jgi:hypothetical protein